VGIGEKGWKKAILYKAGGVLGPKLRASKQNGRSEEDT